jgi:hypothetical protein
MRYLWNMVTGDLVATRDKRTIAILLMDGYVEVSKERYNEIAAILREG